MSVSDDQKRRVRALATSLLDGLNAVGDGDATEGLASLYAAVQVVERELLGRGHLSLDQVIFIQRWGRRLGASMNVAVEEEVLDAGPGEDDDIH